MKNQSFVKYGAVTTIRFFIVLSGFVQQTFIRAGHVVDPLSGTNTLNQIIVVEGKKIVDVGRDISIPPNAKVIDLSKSVVLPGLFDAHTHMCATVNKFADWLGVDYFDTMLLNPSGYRAIQGALHAKEMLQSGFTTIRDAGNSGAYVDVEVKRTINEGLIPGPTMVVAGKIIASVEQKTRGELAIGYITSFVETGIPNADILRALMFVDVIATDKNPLDDIMTLTHASFVMKEGTTIVNKN